MIAEPGTTLSDYALATLCAWAALRTARGPARRIRRWATLLLVCVGIGALVGGTAHGFAPDRESQAFRWLWSATLIAIAGAGVALAGLASAIVLPAGVERIVAGAAGFALVPFAALVCVFPAPFWWALAAYAPALLAFLGALLFDTARRCDATHLAGIGSALITLAAAAVQRRLVAVGSLDHNVAYHLLQMLAIVLIPVWTRLEADAHAHAP